MEKDQIRRNLNLVTGREQPSGEITVREALSQLDTLVQEKSLPRDLAHYLSRRSYMKALEWLDNPDMPHEL